MASCSSDVELTSLLENGAANRRPAIFLYALAVVTLGALIPRLWLGSTQFIHYDGYLHMFIAMQNRWSLFVSEWKADAHPPLYYLGLRALISLGHSSLTYRLLSIIPGILSVFMLGKIADRIFTSKVVALLAAAGYGFSITLIDLDCDVRGYSLCLLFVSCAFYAAINTYRSGANVRAVVAFGVLTSFAIATEYMAVFFYVVCALAIVVKAGRSVLLSRKAQVQFLIGLGLPLVPMLFLYIVHIRHQPAM